MGPSHHSLDIRQFVCACDCPTLISGFFYTCRGVIGLINRRCIFWQCKCSILRCGIGIFLLLLDNIGSFCHQALLGVIVHLVRVKAAFRCQLVKCVLFCIAPVAGRVNVVSRPVGAIGVQVQPIAAVGVLLSESGDDRIVEPRSQVILLRNRIKLLAGKLEAVGDGFLLSRKVAPSVIVVMVKNNAIFINDVGG